MALVDTGATRTVIQKGICRTLNLTPRNRVQMLTAGVPCIAEEFDVSLMFPMLNISFDPIFVLEAPLTGQNISCLIGRDLL
jgi:predicted aspartyl protease